MDNIHYVPATVLTPLGLEYDGLRPDGEVSMAFQYNQLIISRHLTCPFAAFSLLFAACRLPILIARSASINFWHRTSTMCCVGC